MNSRRLSCRVAIGTGARSISTVTNLPSTTTRPLGQSRCLPKKIFTECCTSVQTSRSMMWRTELNSKCILIQLVIWRQSNRRLKTLWPLDWKVTTSLFANKGPRGTIRSVSILSQKRKKAKLAAFQTATVRNILMHNWHPKMTRRPTKNQARRVLRPSRKDPQTNACTDLSFALNSYKSLTSRTSSRN